MALKQRSPGHLRLVTKTAKGRDYERWQWRTHRRSDTGWKAVDVELGAELCCLRTRVLIALGELSAPLLLERWVRWHLRSWEALPAWSGQPAHARKAQRSAWWLEIPRSTGGSVNLRFRSLDQSMDFRRQRSSIQNAKQVATSVWNSLSADPIERLAELLWFQREGQQEVDSINDELIKLRRMKRIGELSHRDYEADERNAYLRLENWEAMVATVERRHDDDLAAMVAAMPRPRRQSDHSRILARADRMLNNPKYGERWKANHWDSGTLTWD